MGPSRLGNQLETWMWHSQKQSLHLLTNEKSDGTVCSTQNDKWNKKILLEGSRESYCGKFLSDLELQLNLSIFSKPYKKTSMLIFLFKNTIGVKQVDILGPIFSLFFICAIMITWRAKLDINPCIFRSKNDNKMTGRRYTARGEELFLLYSEYTIQPSYSLTEIILS